MAAGLGLAVASILAALLVSIARVDRARGRLAVTAVAVYCTAILSPLGWRNNLVMWRPLLYLLVEAALLLRSRVTFASAMLAPGLTTLLGLLAHEILGRARFQGFLELSGREGGHPRGFNPRRLGDAEGGGRGRVEAPSGACRPSARAK